ncbi:phenylacetic acid degradation protein PaaD [Photobacterium ganghwense]|uniref:Acyl-CoA thioesterase n=1 Tax=Photobacterium ganghwense TaxID=320778 RepID=A0A0J1K661_9GAMM|nr:hydroxyphenylacetyl-CoA thioesterase PaaI [Photobacterium ganghwense]KLV09852.1 acyl-CoA thioesterase [Photobacterium ganghwense]PSU09306.1 phenylacetic acid degradation protein PaaD [Photobacterium ganghwense]QSV16493.1 hydroxyphenylacetyl-CoA thioesterase PaaI [Photobacterium ganghwense]
MTPQQQLAWQCAEKMYSQDGCSNLLSLKIEQMDQGSATVSMTVTRDMLNGFETCHGGMIFSLADSAFAFACNSENQVAVAAGCSIEYVRPGRAGDTLTAVAQARSQGKVTGTYDIEITNQDGKLVALFRGKAHRLGRLVLEETP